MSKKEKWYKPTTKMGWKKSMGIEERRGLALDAHGGDYLATARALQALSNISTDATTSKKAAADAKYFYTQHRKYKEE